MSCICSDLSLSIFSCLVRLIKVLSRMGDASPPFASCKAPQSTEKVCHLKASLLKAIMGHCMGRSIVTAVACRISWRIAPHDRLANSQQTRAAQSEHCHVCNIAVSHSIAGFVAGCLPWETATAPLQC